MKKGNNHVAGSGDTYAFCAKPKLELLYTTRIARVASYQYYKVTVDIGTRMTAGKVPETCEEAGLKAVCPGPKGCHYNDESKCVVTPLSSKTKCGNIM